MNTLLLLCALAAVPSKCPGGVCPSPIRVAAASPDTETPRSVWITNEGRYGWGVIRNGYFVAITPTITPSIPTPPVPDLPPAPVSVPGATAIGDAPNYGLDLQGLQAESVGNFTTNDPTFNPKVAAPEVGPLVQAQAAAAPSLQTCGLTLAAVALILLTKLLRS